MSFEVTKAPKIKMTTSTSLPDDKFWAHVGPPLLEASLNDETLTAEELRASDPVLLKSYASTNGLVTRLSARGMFRQKVRHIEVDGAKPQWRTAFVPCRQNAENAAAYMQQFDLLNEWLESSDFDNEADLTAAIAKLPTAAMICPALYGNSAAEE